MLAIRSSIQTFAEDWFGLEILSAPSLAEARGDVLIGLQSQLVMSQKSALQPLIVFEDFSSGFGFRTQSQNVGGIYYLSQP